MCPKEPQPDCPIASICTARLRLAFALILLFIIVLVVAIFFPHAVPQAVFVLITGLLQPVIMFYFRTTGS